MVCMESNLWDRQQNKRARAKKERAKRAFAVSDEDSASFWLSQEELLGMGMGIIAGIHRNRFEVRLVDQGGKICSAPLGCGIDPRAAKDLAVGDRVFVKNTNNRDLSIYGREDRKSFVVRPRGDWTRSPVALKSHVLAANVDMGIITASIKDPDFHPRFVDRYLAILQIGHVAPLICLTKTDLSPERHPVLDFYRKANIPVLETSLFQSRGIEILKTYIRGKTVVFLGQSGVGKSSLVSLILPDTDVAIGEVSEKTGKGQHTTTGSSLLRWDVGSYIIDTPGIRSLGLDQIPKEEIRFLFPEFQELSQGCRFSDCTHASEPGCAVKRALDEGLPSLNRYRYESYLKMMEE